jgi:hypothetical protein
MPSFRIEGNFPRWGSIDDEGEDDPEQNDHDHRKEPERHGC